MLWATFLSQTVFVYVKPLKLLCLSTTTIDGQASHYLGPLTRVADLPGRPALRYAGSNRLHVPYARLSILSASGPFRSPDLKSGSIYLNM